MKIDEVVGCSYLCVLERFFKSKWNLYFFREKETNDHALMLRELQKLVTDERSAKENLEHELQQSQDQIKALKLAGTYNAEYEIRVRDLNSELANKNKILEDLQSKVQKTPPEIIKLKEELSEVKRY